MVTFEIKIAADTYRIMPFKNDRNCYNVFNYATFHVIKRTGPGKWQTIEHRFGREDIPLNEIGDAIDRHPGK